MYDQYHPRNCWRNFSLQFFLLLFGLGMQMLGMVCGDVIVWKPSSKVMLCSIAVHNIISEVLKRTMFRKVVNLLAGGSKYIGDNFVCRQTFHWFPLQVSTRVGKRVGAIVGERLGRSLFELGKTTPSSSQNTRILTWLYARCIVWIRWYCRTTLHIYSSIDHPWICLRNVQSQIGKSRTDTFTSDIHWIRKRWLDHSSTKALFRIFSMQLKMWKTRR